VVTNYSDGNYTGDATDLVFYLEHTDVFTHTTNIPPAYDRDDYTGNPRSLDLVAGRTRRSIDLSRNMTTDGDPLPHLAYAFGVRSWAGWDGEKDGTNYERQPFNLQCFQIWSQLINGALILSPSTGGYGIDPELVIQSAEQFYGYDPDFHISRNAVFETASNTYRHIDDEGGTCEQAGI